MLTLKSVFYFQGTVCPNAKSQATFLLLVPEHKVILKTSPCLLLSGLIRDSKTNNKGKKKEECNIEMVFVRYSGATII